MTGPTVPAKYTNVTEGEIRIGRHSILGAGSIVLPGVTIAEGVACGAMTLFRTSTTPWTIYVGAPARALKGRDRGLLEMERAMLAEEA